MVNAQILVPHAELSRRIKELWYKILLARFSHQYNSSLKQAEDGTLYVMPKDFLYLGHHNLLKYSETLPTGRTLKMDKMQNFGFCLQDFKKLLR